MQRTKIEWADDVWNPIKGLCPVGCWYCYARKIYQRFKRDPEVRLDLDELMADFPKRPSRIFACSTFELFHPLADPYRNNVFKHIGLLPEHTFIILTKMPERIDRPMPDNVWLGVSITGEDDLKDYRRVQELKASRAKIHFVSAEPLLGDVYAADLFGEFKPDWLIVGKLTGHGRKHDPDESILGWLIHDATELQIPLFMKNNLKNIWPGPLIQEWPK